MPNFSTTEAEYQAACLSARSSTLSSYPAQAAGAGPSQSFNPLLQPPAAPSPRAASKRSPKLWPKKSVNAVSASTPALPMAEWSGLFLDTKEDFSKLHQEFGKEVKELIAQWSKRACGGEAGQQENLIDFG